MYNTLFLEQVLTMAIRDDYQSIISGPPRDFENLTITVFVREN